MNVFLIIANYSSYAEPQSLHWCLWSLASFRTLLGHQQRGCIFLSLFIPFLCTTPNHNCDLSTAFSPHWGLWGAGFSLFFYRNRKCQPSMIATQKSTEQVSRCCRILTLLGKDTQTLPYLASNAGSRKRRKKNLDGVGSGRFLVPPQGFLWRLLHHHAVGVLWVLAYPQAKRFTQSQLHSNCYLKAYC